jgi:flagellar assembly protein FliH
MTVQPFTFDNFSPALGDADVVLVEVFDEPATECTQEEGTADVEEQARKIFEDAYTQGEKAGYEMGIKKVEQIARRLNTYLSELPSLKERLVERCERLSVELALLFAEAIILRECSEKKQIIVEMAKKALDICEAKSDIIVRLRREDAQHLTASNTKHLNIVPDDTLKEPGFIIETAFGDIDGRISTQLAELRKEFLDDRTG